MAKLLDVSTRTLRADFAAGCPRGPLAAIKKWRSLNRFRPGSELATEISPRAKWTAKLKREEYRRRKRENDIADGKLMPKADAIDVITAMLIKVKTRLEALPIELQMLFPADVRVMVRRDFADAIRKILKEMSQWRI